MDVTQLPIPSQLRDLLLSSGIRDLYPPQQSAISLGALEGRNLIIASPTASGKTLIAELCALKHLLESSGKVLYLVPLRALAWEKYQLFKKYESLVKKDGSSIKIGISTGDLDSSDPWLEQFDIIIASNEKAESLIRHGARWISKLSLIIADEIHLLGDPERGPTLEMLLARLIQLNPRAQILGLSATIGNPEEISSWLGALPVISNWRPVPLKEGVYLDGYIFFGDGTSRKISVSGLDPPIELALDTIGSGGQALIFAESRRAAVSLARKSLGYVSRMLNKHQKRILEQISDRVLELGERTRLSEILARCIRSGVGIHHAGFSADHRRLVEQSFRDGHLKLIITTPTLALGVNLPARLVVIGNYRRYEPGYGMAKISVLEQKQFGGRAGRPGYDEYGESVMIAKSRNELVRLMNEYILAQPEPIFSKLGNPRVLRSHVLASIVSGFGESMEELLELFSKTLHWFQYGPTKIRRLIQDSLDFLISKGFLELEDSRYIPTQLGIRTSQLYIDPETALILVEGLTRAESGKVEPTELSWLQLICSTPDQLKLHPRESEWDKLRRMLKLMQDEILVPLDEDSIYEDLLAGLRTALVLRDWIHESSEDSILADHGVEPGDLYRLIESGKWLLYAARELGKLLGFRRWIHVLDELRRRVEHGVKSELLELVELAGIGRIRARSLYDHGFKTIGDLARASVRDLIRVPGIGEKIAIQIKNQLEHESSGKMGSIGLRQLTLKDEELGKSIEDL